jgi:hypothetical protein
MNDGTKTQHLRALSNAGQGQTLEVGPDLPPGSFDVFERRVIGGGHLMRCDQFMLGGQDEPTDAIGLSSGRCGTRASGYTDRAPVPPYAVCSSRRRREQQHQRDQGSERASRIILPLARNTSQKPPVEAPHRGVSTLLTIRGSCSFVPICCWPLPDGLSEGAPLGLASFDPVSRRRPCASLILRRHEAG